MSTPSLATLKQGLISLQNLVEARKTRIEASLKKGERVSDEDSNWLDNEANVVDEVFVIDLLTEASDYDAAVKRLKDTQLAAVHRLAALGATVASEKTGGTPAQDPPAVNVKPVLTAGAKCKCWFVLD